IVCGFILGKTHALVTAFVQLLLCMVVRCNSRLMLFMHWAVLHTVGFVRFVRALLRYAAERQSHNCCHYHKNAFHRFSPSSPCNFRRSPGDVMGEMSRTLSGWLAINISSSPARFPGAV